MKQQTPTQDRAARRTAVITIGQNERVIQAARVMHANRVGCLVVVSDQQVMVGVVSERDILRWVGTGTAESFGQRVEDIMTAHVISCPPDTPIAEARRLMARHEVRHLPVVENGRPVGMISVHDVLARRLPPTAKTPVKDRLRGNEGRPIPTRRSPASAPRPR